MEKESRKSKIYEKSIKHWPKDERPREKLFKSGEHTLSNTELLAILLRSGVEGQSAIDLSRKIISKFSTFREMSHTDIREWREFKGLGQAKIAQIKASIEIGRFVIHDPAAGTGGFLVCAYEWLMEQTKGSLERDDAKRITNKVYTGTELVARPRRLALMNLYLHGIHADIYLGDSIYEPLKSTRYDCVLTNPPFGTKGANQAPERDDFTISTSNKQLNFIQHVVNILKPGGGAAMVLPDNCLFEDKATEVIEILTQDCNLHTILRLPRGTFTPYSQGVKANVIFFQRGLPTENVWIFDARSNVAGITKKDRPLSREHFKEFEKCYGADPNGQGKRTDLGIEGRFRRFNIAEIKDRGYKLDVTWLKDESLDDPENLPEPQVLASEAIAELETVVDSLKEIVAELESNGE